MGISFFCICKFILSLVSNTNTYDTYCDMFIFPTGPKTAYGLSQLLMIGFSHWSSSSGVSRFFTVVSFMFWGNSLPFVSGRK